MPEADVPTPRGAFGALACALVASACAVTPEPYVDPLLSRGIVGEEIVVAGERVHVGAPVVLWFEEPFYSAYDTLPRFGAVQPDGLRGLRYRKGREGAGSTPDRAALEAVVDQLVLHYDACGLSRTCFRVLHDERGLSAHFLVDLDGTIYQTLDLADTAWHARQANRRSIGVEIANLGAYAPGAQSPLDEWTEIDADGLRITIPDRHGDGGLRTPDFVARPARPTRIRGQAQGETLEQLDYTPEQYESLAHLTAALVDTFPLLALEVPRDGTGAVRTDRMPEAEEATFGGVVGHLHVSTQKLDPGPAFDWEGYLEATRALTR